MLKFLQFLEKWLIKVENYFEKMLRFSEQSEEEAKKYIQKRFKYQVESVQIIGFNSDDNSENRIRGDLKINLKNGTCKYIEVKSYRKASDNICFEVIETSDFDVILNFKQSDYYLFLIPDREPLLLDYFLFSTAFEKLKTGKKVCKNKSDNGRIMWFKIDDVLKEINNLVLGVA